jgi:hypothetical protein
VALAENDWLFVDDYLRFSDIVRDYSSKWVTGNYAEGLFECAVVATTKFY